jgi:hypothetical protein
MFVFLFAFQLALADSAVDALESRWASAEDAQPGIYVLEEPVAEWELDVEEEAPARRLPPSESSSPKPAPADPTPTPTAAEGAEAEAGATPTPTPAPTSEATWAFAVMGTIALQA